MPQSSGPILTGIARDLESKMFLTSMERESPLQAIAEIDGPQPELPIDPPHDWDDPNGFGQEERQDQRAKKDCWREIKGNPKHRRQLCQA